MIDKNWAIFDLLKKISSQQAKKYGCGKNFNFDC